ncbi:MULTISPECIES: hypothetical protein [Aeromicrobium]|uniref:hypothetical protein n=1 Tax=Aeromicrobium TaxID=2040 RepID=UPI00257A5A1A|nr:MULTISPECIES: hypothetical protein [Aeromicrobium]
MARRRRSRSGRAPSRSDEEAGSSLGLTRRVKVIAAGLASIVAAWAVSYFGPGIWSQAQEVAGRDPLQVTVLQSDEFDSMVEADHRGEHVWPPEAPEVKTHAAAHIAARGGEAAMEAVGAPVVYDAATTLFRLQLRAATDEPVTIHQFAVKMQDRQPPLAGYWFTGDKGGAADVSYLAVSLDDEKVVWLDPVTGRESQPKSLEVTRSDLEFVDVLARATACACSWRLELTYSTADGERGRIEVAPGPGEDDVFRTTGLDAAAVVHLPYGCTPPAGSPDLCEGLPQSESG